MIKNGEPILKQNPADFIVSEVLIPDLSNIEKGDYHYYKIKKIGVTTFEAIQEIALYFNIELKAIKYAGLKDEDGITEQYISGKFFINQKNIQLFNNTFNRKRLIYITYVCSKQHPLEIGLLLGNSFKIVIRNLELPLIKKINQKDKKHSVNFLNYYGPQRFGVKDGIKNTHFLGEYIIKEDYKNALIALSAQPNHIGNLAKNALMNCENPKTFFLNKDSQIIAFYQSAYYSFLWNNTLAAIVEKNKYYKKHSISSIDYYFLSQEKIKFIINSLPYKRIIPTDSGYKEKILNRQTVVQLNFICTNFYEDAYHSGKWACETSFFLPSGSYATIAISQLINYFREEYN